VQLLDGHLRVREALVKGRFTTPKSKTSRRLIELGPRTKQLLAEHWQASAYNGDNDLVFAHPQKGTPLDPARLAREHLKPALKKAGIVKPFRPFHDLRHTALTHEAAAGNPLSYIQMKAGHSQAAVTERYIPVGRAGVYVPGGLVTYPSSVLMNVVPAQVAGVPQIAAVWQAGKSVA